MLVSVWTLEELGLILTLKSLDCVFEYSVAYLSHHSSATVDIAV